MIMAAFLRSLRQRVVTTVASGTAVLVLIEVTTHLPSQGRSSATYHSLVDETITPLLRSYLDAERAHDIALKCAKWGLAPIYRPSAQEQTLPLKTTVLGLSFNSPIGLAAGFDKNGSAIQPLLLMGFGAVEIGSVTPLAQHGNPKPRMFRLLEQSAIINRYGFNSEGLDAVEKNLHAYRQSLLPPQIQERPTQPLHRIVYAWEQFSHGLTCLHKRLFPLHFYTPSSLVGVNLGKNKTSENEIDDYCRGIRQLGPYADYLVINVSSPNTPGLRDLQAPSSLKTLVTECLEERNSLDTRPPLLVKLAPDLTNEELTEIADTLMECGIDGLIVSNTTNQRPASLALSTAAGEAGGLSGPPLKDRSTECIKVLFARTRGKLPIIGVGGISSAHDVLEKLHAGASCVQIYSVLAYSGPGVVTKMRHELAQLLKQQGFTSVEQAVGYSHEEIYVQLRQERLLKEKEAQAEEEETIQALG